ncbi:hypothetical protein BDDG_12904 [Blastomyces dermatitidis ATCC 18188]|uniref:Uncharacterized protein n=1 Tax=Ajellomyces dermatitidis (strain ATCC 18188 / CBS 674.68) TaxID=653446 RepID=A0A0J9EQP1_AJEDA|nr:hypothetical protein BDDG_12904 [Blastomyces dermatitidis ATCC 18188]
MRVAAKMMSTGFYVPIGSGAKFSLRAIFHHRPPYRRFSDTEAQQAGMLVCLTVTGLKNAIPSSGCNAAFVMRFLPFQSFLLRSGDQRWIETRA